MHNVNDSSPGSDLGQARRFTDCGRDARCQACRQREPGTDDSSPRACGCAFSLAGPCQYVSIRFTSSDSACGCSSAGPCYSCR